MQAPSDEDRREVERSHFESEEDCEQALDLIDVMMERAGLEFDEHEQHPEEALEAVEGWLGLMSYAVARTYAPASPMRFPGWSRRVIGRLRAMVQRFQGALQRIAALLGVKGYSIGVSFPWGVQLSLNW